MLTDAATHECPRPRPFHEIEQVLRDLAELEAALAMEIRRLSTMGAPQDRRGNRATHRGRPVWWWRAMLVSWAYAPATKQAHPTDVLRGLRHILKDFTDRELVAFLQQMPDATSQEPSAA